MELFAHFWQITGARCHVDGDVVNERQVMSGSFYVMPQIEGLRFDRQISGEWSLQELTIIESAVIFCCSRFLLSQFLNFIFTFCLNSPEASVFLDAWRAATDQRCPFRSKFATAVDSRFRQSYRRCSYSVFRLPLTFFDRLASAKTNINET